MRHNSFFAIIGVFVATISSTRAAPPSGPPEASLGNNPHRSFAGDLCSDTVTLMTVPAGQEFIVTGVTSTIEGASSHLGGWESGTALMQDGMTILGSKAISPRSGVPVSKGNGRLRVEEGTTLSIRKIGMPWITCAHYYVQGYFVQAGSPYRSFFGISSSSSYVFTADEDRDFIAKTVVLYSRAGPSNCHVWVDGTKMVHGTTMATLDWGTYSGSFGGGGFAQGHGQLVVPAGSSLSAGPDDSDDVECDYYIEGEYVVP